MSPLRYRYQTIEFGDKDIHLRTLRDNQQYSDPDNVARNLGVPESSWPLFGIVWESSKVLTSMMHDYKVDKLRILEVGCGIGLASLMLNERFADITATDYHPCAGEFLARNVSLNNCREIPFVRAGWADETTKLGKFDLIIGSDLLYEPDHIILLSNFINNHANTECEVIIIDPGRGGSSRFSKKMQQYGFTCERYKAESPDCVKQTFTGHVLHLSRVK